MCARTLLHRTIQTDLRHRTGCYSKISQIFKKSFAVGTHWKSLKDPSREYHNNFFHDKMMKKMSQFFECKMVFSMIMAFELEREFFHFLFMRKCLP